MWTKNIEMAIKAFIQFKSNYPQYARFRLVVAGQINVKNRSYLMKLQGITSGRDDVEFVISPSDDAFWNLYANCYSVLFPAFNEDWGIVPLEANAYGKPVIATNCGGPRESQVNEQTGYLVPSEPKAFSQAMARLAADEHLVRTIGRAARDSARQYDWSHFVNRIDAVVEEIVKAASPPG